MSLRIKQWSTNPYLWLTLSGVVVLLPLILLGSPGLYGDDYNSYQAIENFGGLGAINHWLSTYGWSYRPSGIAILYSYYSLLSGNHFLLYLGYQLFYLMLSFVLFREIYKLTDNTIMSVFVALFFLFFPFNSSAYWQISSLMMVLAIAVSIIIIRLLVTSASKKLNNIFLLSVLAWIILLFTYEQLLGLVAVISILILAKNYSVNIVDLIREVFIPLMILGFVSLVFLGGYFLSESNPKIVSLKRINNVESVAHEKSTDHVIVNSQSIKQVQDKEYSAQIKQDYPNLGKLDHFINRVNKGINFLVSSISYSLQSLISSGMAGYIMLVAILALGILAFFVPIVIQASTKQTSLFYVFVGTIWMAVTLAPFFLYDKVHIPPYTLMLPSIGLGITIFGMFQFVMPLLPIAIAIMLTRVLLVVGVIILPLMQYGYYFGLNEELRYWEKIAGEIHSENAVIEGNTIVLTGVTKKKNSHIFWLEKGVGVRYISELIESDVRVISVLHDSDRLVLTISRNTARS